MATVVAAGYARRTRKAAAARTTSAVQKRSRRVRTETRGRPRGAAAETAARSSGLRSTESASMALLANRVHLGGGAPLAGRRGWPLLNRRAGARCRARAFEELVDVLTGKSLSIGHDRQVGANRVLVPPEEQRSHERHREQLGVGRAKQLLADQPTHLLLE